MKPISVLVADDQHLVREGIASLLSLQKTLFVEGTVSNGREAVNFITRTPVDVVLMDIRMPVMDGISATQRLKDTGFPGKVLMLTTFEDEEFIVKSLMAGASGYLLKDIPMEDLARAIQQVHNGVTQFSESIMGLLVPGAAAGGVTTISEEKKQLISGLTPREKEVLKEISLGLTNREIAGKINLSEGTVKNYVSGILLTLNLPDRTKAALLASHFPWDNK